VVLPHGAFNSKQYQEDIAIDIDWDTLVLLLDGTLFNL